MSVDGPIRALTLYPEHAELFRLRIRWIETRGWSTKYRGPLAIHAGMRDPDSAAAQRDPQTRAAYKAIPHGNPLTRGAVVATCTLADVVPIVDLTGCRDHSHHVCLLPGGALAHSPLSDPWPDGETEHEATDQLPFGIFTPGRFAWLLADMQPLAVPIPAKGRQGLWTWDA